MRLFTPNLKTCIKHFRFGGGKRPIHNFYGIYKSTKIFNWKLTCLSMTHYKENNFGTVNDDLIIFGIILFISSTNSRDNEYKQLFHAGNTLV